MNIFSYIEFVNNFLLQHGTNVGPLAEIGFTNLGALDVLNIKFIKYFGPKPT